MTTEKRHTSVKPVRTRERHDEWGVDISRVVGYRVVYPDGSHGPTRRTVALALLDKRTAPTSPAAA